jgi:hypothetical protein
MARINPPESLQEGSIDADLIVLGVSMLQGDASL